MRTQLVPSSLSPLISNYQNYRVSTIVTDISFVIIIGKRLSYQQDIFKFNIFFLHKPLFAYCSTYLRVLKPSSPKEKYISYSVIP